MKKYVFFSAIFGLSLLLLTQTKAGLLEYTSENHEDRLLDILNRNNHGIFLEKFFSYGIEAPFHLADKEGKNDGFASHSSKTINDYPSSLGDNILKSRTLLLLGFGLVVLSFFIGRRNRRSNSFQQKKNQTLKDGRPIAIMSRRTQSTQGYDLEDLEKTNKDDILSG